MAWEILEEETIHKGIRSLKKEKVRYPDGNVGNYYYLTGNDSVLVMGRVEGKLVIIRQHRHTIRQDTVEFASGVMEDGETPEKAAERELEEETGYSVGRLQKLGSFYENYGFSNHRMHVFLATQLTEGKQRLDSGAKGFESITVGRASLEEFHEMIRKGEISGMASILAFYMLKDAIDAGKIELE